MHVADTRTIMSYLHGKPVVLRLECSRNVLSLNGDVIFGTACFDAVALTDSWTLDRTELDFDQQASRGQIGKRKMNENEWPIGEALTNIS